LRFFCAPNGAAPACPDDAHRSCGRLVPFAIALCFAACAHPDKPDLAGRPRTAIAEHMLEQIGTGREATFAVCIAKRCPKRTPKTLPWADMTDIPMPSAPPPSAGLTPYALIVAFDTGSATLSAQAEDVIRTVAQRPAQGHTALIGHTDGVGTTPGDLMLALARVHAVRDRLLRLRPELEMSLHTEAEYDCGHVAMAGTRSHRALGGSVLIVFEPAAPP
jgi:hypothetical protein